MTGLDQDVTQGEGEDEVMLTVLVTDTPLVSYTDICILTAILSILSLERLHRLCLLPNYVYCTHTLRCISWNIWEAVWADCILVSFIKRCRGSVDACRKCTQRGATLRTCLP